MGDCCITSVRSSELLHPAHLSQSVWHLWGVCKIKIALSSNFIDFFFFFWMAAKVGGLRAFSDAHHLEINKLSAHPTRPPLPSPFSFHIMENNLWVVFFPFLPLILGCYLSRGAFFEPARLVVKLASDFFFFLYFTSQMTKCLALGYVLFSHRWPLQKAWDSCRGCLMVGKVLRDWRATSCQVPGLIVTITFLHTLLRLEGVTE